MKKFNKKLSFILASGCMLVVASLCTFGVLQFNQQSAENYKNLPEVVSANQDANNTVQKDAAYSQNGWSAISVAKNTAEVSNETSSSITEEVVVDADQRYANVFGDDSVAGLKMSSPIINSLRYNANAEVIYWEFDKDIKTLSIGNKDSGLENSFNSSEPAP